MCIRDRDRGYHLRHSHVSLTTIACASGLTGEAAVFLVHSHQVDPLGGQPRRTQHLRGCSKDLLEVWVMPKDLVTRHPWLTPLASAHPVPSSPGTRASSSSILICSWVWAACSAGLLSWMDFCSSKDVSPRRSRDERPHHSWCQLGHYRMLVSPLSLIHI